MVKRLFPIFIILATWFIFSKPYFFDGKIPYPSDYQVNHESLWNRYEKFWGPVKNPAMPDVVGQLMPWKHFTIESWKNLNIPLWNPYSFSGTPHLANYQSSVFSITNLFFFVFPFNDGWSLAVLIQPLLAGVFMYLFIRSLKLSQMAGLISSISFMFCGFIVVWMSWTTLSLAISFLPLALFSVEKYFSSRKPVFLFLLFLSVPLSFFSGHFQISLYFSLFVLAYIFFKFAETRNKMDLLNSLIFFALGILFLSPQLLPSMELYFNAPRSLIFQKIEAVELYHLPTILSPDFYGNPVTRNNPLGHYIEWNGFFGVVPFILGIYAIFAKSKKAMFFLLAFITSLLLCLNTPIVDLLVRLQIPVISTSALSRILGIFSFSGAVLSAFGFDYLKKDLEKRRFRKILFWLFIVLGLFGALWLFLLANRTDADIYPVAYRNLILPTVLATGLIIGAIISTIHKRLIIIFILIALSFTIFDMLRFAIKWEPFESKDLTFVNTPIINKLLTLDNTYRTLGPYGAEGSVYYKIPSTEGYDPLYIGRYGEFINTLYSTKITSAARLGVKLSPDAKHFSKTIDLLGIRYILQKHSDIGKPWAFPFKNFPKNKFGLIYKDSKFSIYQNREVFPRAFLVSSYKIANNNQKIIDIMLDKNFDLRKNAVVEKDPHFKQRENSKSTASVINYQPNKIDIETNSNNNSLLILTDNYYPGWKAKVNGKEVEVLRADYTFRAISVPKGKNKIEFYYIPDSFKWGIILAFISIVSIGFLTMGKWYTNKKWNLNK